MKSKRRTSTKEVTRRGGLFLIVFLILFLSVSGLTVYAGIKNGDFERNIVKPLREKIESISKSLEEDSSPTSQTAPEADSGASSETDSVLNNQELPSNINSTYSVPNYTYPTPKPGEPGSKEWEADFNKKFNEMSQQNAAKQKEVEEAQKKFCQDHPTVCN